MTIFTIHNSILSREARDAARDSNKRIQNWEYSTPSQYKKSLGEYDRNDAGNYKGNFRKYTCYQNIPRYTSFIEIEGNILKYHCGFIGHMKSKIVKIPKNFKIEKDVIGIKFVRITDNMDYHFTGDHIVMKNFITHVKNEMARNYKKRVELRANKKKDQKNERYFLKDLGTTMVSLDDSRKAGNCIEGSLQFAVNNLGMERETIIQNMHLFSVNGKRLWKIAEKTGENRAKNAVRAAWNRETLVMI